MALDLSSAPTAPPRSGKSKQSAAVKAASGKQAKRQESVNGVFQLGTLGLTMAGQYADAGALGKYGPSIAVELAKLAETDDKIAKAIDYLDNVGPYGALVTVLVPFALQIAANHKLVQAEAFGGAGVVHPDQLTADVKLQMARMRQKALEAQAEAEKELGELRAKWEKEASQAQAQAASMGTQAAA